MTKKEKLLQDVTALIQEFENETGVSVTRIEFHRAVIQTHGDFTPKIPITKVLMIAG
jgi:hypothetical protein